MQKIAMPHLATHGFNQEGQLTASMELTIQVFLTHAQVRLRVRQSCTGYGIQFYPVFGKIVGETRVSVPFLIAQRTGHSKRRNTLKVLEVWTSSKLLLWVVERVWVVIC